MSATSTATPPPTSGQVDVRWRACIHSSTRPVSPKNTQAAATTSMKRVQAMPVFRPLCRSLK